MSGKLEVPVLIGRKRDGESLTADEITALIAGYLADDVTDAQMAALLMAGVCNGFDDTEATALTEAYLRSGEVVDLSHLSGPTVDKHSTGGVGDTATLVVEPLLAAAGCQVAKLSGRGLGHTGGTLDKLEAIPGFRVDLDGVQFRAQVERLGLAVAAAPAELVPADTRIYALRDVTGTVPSEALIAASVMSKKLAGGAQHIVLDVKVGDGAFMRTLPEARALARRCVAIGTDHGRRVSALVTGMSQPLGPAIGNALEVGAAVAVLQGAGGDRLREVGLALAAEALVLTGVARPHAQERVTRLLDDGTALERFAAWVEAQGGDPTVAEDPAAVLPSAPVVRPWRPRGGDGGFVQAVAARRLGELAGRLGAGRMHAGDELDPRVGLVVHVAVGEAVPDGPAIEVHAASEAEADAVVAELDGLVEVAASPIEQPAVIVDRITA